MSLSNLLYKFRDWDSCYGKKILTKRKIYFSSFSNFNDPFDSDIRVNYEDRTPEEIDKIFSRIVEEDYPGLSPFNKRVKIEHYKSKSDIGDPEKLRENYEQVVRPTNEEEMGIFSLSKTKENILLWSHYSNSHKGFSVGIKRDYLQEIANSYTLKSYLTAIEEITYSEYYPDINPADDDPNVHLKPLLIKSSDWKYEEEVRFIIRGVINKSIKIPKEAIQEVNLGLKILSQNKDEILELISSQMPHIKVFQVEKSDKKFALNFNRIS